MTFRREPPKWWVPGPRDELVFLEEPPLWRGLVNLVRGLIASGAALAVLVLWSRNGHKIEDSWMLLFVPLGAWMAFEEFHFTYRVLSKQYRMATPEELEAERCRRIGQTALDGDWEENKRLLNERREQQDRSS